MFEIGIFCVIALAIGYWTTLFLMGRREDVLHGDFVQDEQGPEPAPAPFPAPPPAARAASADSLQSLLATIKRDLKDAAQI
jgi:hypothetical protein